MTAAALGFDRPTANSLDAVSDRDFVAECCFVLTLLICLLYTSDAADE